MKTDTPQRQQESAIEQMRRENACEIARRNLEKENYVTPQFKKPYVDFQTWFEKLKDVSMQYWNQPACLVDQDIARTFYDINYAPFNAGRMMFAKGDDD